MITAIVGVFSRNWILAGTMFGISIVSFVPLGFPSVGRILDEDAKKPEAPRIINCCICNSMGTGEVFEFVIFHQVTTSRVRVGNTIRVEFTQSNFLPQSLGVCNKCITTKNNKGIHNCRIALLVLAPLFFASLTWLLLSSGELTTQFWLTVISGLLTLLVTMTVIDDVIGSGEVHRPLNLYKKELSELAKKVALDNGRNCYLSKKAFETNKKLPKRRSTF